jgi:hypothetical protein
MHVAHLHQCAFQQSGPSVATSTPVSGLVLYTSIHPHWLWLTMTLRPRSYSYLSSSFPTLAKCFALVCCQLGFVCSCNCHCICLYSSSHIWPLLAGRFCAGEGSGIGSGIGDKARFGGRLGSAALLPFPFTVSWEDAPCSDA